MRVQEGLQRHTTTRSRLDTGGMHWMSELSSIANWMCKSMGTTITGTKLPARYECPIDTFLYAFVSPIVDICYDLGLTPNCVTALGALASYRCLQAFAAGDAVTATVLWALHYYLDCADGMFARRYNMETPLGDACDHVLDLAAYTGFLVIAWSCVQRGASPWPFAACILFGLLAVHHLTCQQLYDGGLNAPISGLSSLPVPQCTNVAHLASSRWYGTGTANIIILVAMYYYCRVR